MNVLDYFRRFYVACVNLKQRLLNRTPALRWENIEQIYKDVVELDDETFRKFSFLAFQAVMQILYHKNDQDRACVITLNVMLERGFNVNAIRTKWTGGYYRNTELMKAISRGRDVRREAAMILLRDLNANPFIADQFGKNALHLLLLKGHEVQRPLLDVILSRPNIEKHINDKMRDGNTALHIACARRDEKIITELLKKGADAAIKNDNGQTPMKLLYLNKRVRLDLLKKCMTFSTTGNAAEPMDAFANNVTIDKEIFDADVSLIEGRIRSSVERQKLEAK